MQVDPTQYAWAAYLVIFILAWLFPPRWIQGIFDNIAEQVKDLKTWTPRLMGALRGTAENQAEYVAQAQQQDGIVGLITSLAPILPHLPQLMQLAQQFGVVVSDDHQQQQQQQGGGPSW